MARLKYYDDTTGAWLYADAAGASVNPVEKTEDMTQPVGKDSNGRLWTSVPEEQIFIADYDTVTFSDISEAYLDGKLIYLMYKNVTSSKTTVDYFRLSKGSLNTNGTGVFVFSNLYSSNLEYEENTSIIISNDGEEDSKDVLDNWFAFTRPAQKTTSMNQSVGIDANGKLWTSTPSSDDVQYDPDSEHQEGSVGAELSQLSAEKVDLTDTITNAQIDALFN